MHVVISTVPTIHFFHPMRVMAQEVALARRGSRLFVLLDWTYLSKRTCFFLTWGFAAISQMNVGPCRRYAAFRDSTTGAVVLSITDSIMDWLLRSHDEYLRDMRGGTGAADACQMDGDGDRRPK